MPGIPTFDPQGSPGEAGEVYRRSADTASSLMERGQRMRQQDQLMEMQREQFEVARPVMRAKAAADVATIGATLTNAKQVEDYRRRFAEESPQALREFQDIQNATYTAEETDESGNIVKPAERDWRGYYDALQNLRAKYNWMGLVQEGQGFIKQLDAAATQAHVDAVTDAKFKQQQEILTLTNDRLLDVARIRSVPKGSKEERWFQLMQQARLDGDSEAFNLYEGLLQKAQATSAGTSRGFAQILDQYERVKADPNSTPEELSLWESRAKTAAAGSGLNFLFMGAGGGPESVPHTSAAGTSPAITNKPGTPESTTGGISATPSGRMAEVTPPKTETAAPEYKTSGDVARAVAAGTLKREDALKILREQFGLK